MGNENFKRGGCCSKLNILKGPAKNSSAVLGIYVTRASAIFNYLWCRETDLTFRHPFFFKIQDADDFTKF
jgi:hypothetical protein